MLWGKAELPWPTSLRLRQFNILADECGMFSRWIGTRMKVVV